MPTTYAHYRFGCDVLHMLEGQQAPSGSAATADRPSLADIIKKERELFDWGVHGPDLCFYYHPLRDNAVFRAGRYYHKKTGRQFFRQQAELLRKQTAHADESTDSTAPYISYLLGVLCHYVLDRECHPYVAEKESDGFSHDGLEAYFDRFLIQQDGHIPNTYMPTGHLHVSERSAAVISDFYPEITPAEFLEAERGMLRILGLLNSPALARTFFRCAASVRGAGDKFIPLWDDPKYTGTNAELLELYDAALARYPEMLTQLISYIRNRTPLGPEFENTFSVD